MKILRNNATKEITVQMQKNPSIKLVPYIDHEKKPSYFILGGAVFQPLDENYLRSFGSYWYDSAPIHLMHHFYFSLTDKKRKELVILNHVLPDACNFGYHQMKDLIVTKVNGNKVRSFTDFVKRCLSSEREYYTITFENNHELILRKELVQECNMELLNRYSISSDRSKNLNNLDQ